MKRVCSLLLSLSLLLSAVQPMALAAELDASDEVTAVAAAEVDDVSSEEEAEADVEEETEADAEDGQDAEASEETEEAEAETEEVEEEAPAAEDEDETSAEDESEATVSAAYVDNGDDSLTLELSEGTPADGTYTGTATVEDVYDDFDDYEIEIAFTFADGALTDVELTSTISDRHNKSYFSDAAEGYGSYTGIYDQLLGGSTTVDVVTEATCSSKGIVAAYEDAYAQAVAANTDSEEEAEVYAYMNVPYADFYAGLNDDGDVDTVTSATTSKAANCKNVYLTVDSDAGTTSIYGVVVPVKMSAATYEAVAGLVTDSTAAYYVGETVEDPAVYLELTYADGAYTFSDIQGESTASTVTDTELSSASVWGDYELDLSSDYGIATTEVYGAYFTTTDGTQYAMKQSANLWTPSTYYEFAWDTIDDTYYGSMEGKTIESVTYITTSGFVVYTLDDALYVQEHMSSVPTVEFLSATTIFVSNLADDAADVSVTVKASGRNGTSLTDEGKTVVDGVATLDTAATDGTTYQVTITSSNYATNIVTATYSETYVYAYMNVPYADFYAGLNDNGDVDTVTSATTSKAANCKNVYLTVDSDAGTTSIYGVVVPVKMSAATYEAVAGLVTDSTAAYYVGETVEDPAVYLELTYADGAYTFSDIQGESTASTVTDTELSSASVWGDYELDLSSDYGIATTEVYGAYFTTTDGTQYAMKQSANLWTPSTYYEFAWDTIDDTYYGSMEGKTIESVTYITTSGFVVYTLDEALYVQEHMSDVPTAEFTSATTIAISNLAEDAENVTVTVKASGRNGTYLTDEAVSVVDGVATLDTAATDGTTYQVTISSDNYASNIVTATYVAQDYYVLMNIPYDEFYAADVNNDVPVDAFTSATKAKTQTWSLSGGSYHVSEDGSDITGVTFPVKVPAGTDLSAYTQITDDDSLEITVTNRGTTSTTTYTGYQALYQADSYSYYVLSSDPSYYKELTVSEDGSFSFGAVVGESTTVTASAELTTDTSYGDYQLTVDGITDYVTAGTDDVYGVILHTEEGSDYGLRHLENIWRVSELAFCTGFTTAVHNCPTSSAHYEAIMGQTITGITYYTSAGIYEVALSESVYVPTKTDVTVTVEDAYVLDGQTTFTVDGTLADDFEAVYRILRH
ncbi:MAG: FMN-binding protein [Clostridiales bacterium]|nr:FMN-binding protein [Clostridiales bacterium]